MSNAVKDTDIKNRTYYFFSDIIIIKNFDPNHIKIDEKVIRKYSSYYIRYVTIKDSKYVTVYSVNPFLHFIFRNVNEYFEDINKSKYLLIKGKEKKYEELWSKIRDLIRLITKSSDDYDEKYMKIKFNSDDKLPLNKTIKIPTITIFV